MIEVGEYLRIDNGIIGRYVKFMGNQDSIETNNKWIGFNIEKDIAKHSKNIIDLIEVGDYVNGEPVEKIEKDEFDLIEITTTTECLYKPEDIKSIVTKEQFKSIEYRLEA